MTVSEKAAYLRGMMDAMNLDPNTNEGKLFKAISDLLDDLALSVADLEEETSAMRDYIDEMDDDLAALESEVYDDDYDYDDYDYEDEDEDEDEEEDDFDDEDDFEDEDDEDDEEDEDDEGEEPVALECPACGETVYCDIDELESRETLICPACGKELDIVRIDDMDDEEYEEFEGDGAKPGAETSDGQPEQSGKPEAD